MPFNIVLLLLLVGGLALMGLALSGYGSRDRSHQESPRLPGHTVQDKAAERENPDAK